VEVFCYGFFTSLQYTSMNTLVFADVTDEEASSEAPSKYGAATVHHLRIATASLLTSFFFPRAFNPILLNHRRGSQTFYVLVE